MTDQQAEFGADVLHVKEPLWELMETIEKAARGEPSERYVPTGFADLDALTGGLARGELMVVAGRPSSGKSAFALNIATNLVSRSNSVGWYGFDTTRQALTERLLSSEARVDSRRLRNGLLRDDDFVRLAQTAGLLSKARLWLYAASDRRVQSVLSSIRSLIEAEHVAVVFVDGLQGISADRTEDGAREFRPHTLSSFTRGLKSLAVELNVAVVLTCAVGPYPDQRSGGGSRPIVADLKDCPSVEQDADTLVFLYRQELYDGPVDCEGNSIEGLAEAIVAKQRNGPTGLVRLWFSAPHMRFQDLTPQGQK